MEWLGMKHTTEDDFEDPDIEPAHPFRRLVLYRLKRQLNSIKDKN